MEKRNKNEKVCKSDCECSNLENKEVKTKTFKSLKENWKIGKLEKVV